MASPLVHESESSVQTACPLDCPDGCSLSVTVRDGRVVALDGSDANPVTHGYICAKVRRFPERVYGDARLRFPLVRSGPKDQPKFSRLDWGEALDLIAEKMRGIAAQFGPEAILPFCYGGSNGFLTQDSLDAVLFRRLGTSRLARTVCAAPTGAANLALYGKMPSVVYQDYPDAQLVVLWGMNPATSGIHSSRTCATCRSAARRSSSSTRVRRRWRARRTCTWRCGRAPTSRSRWRCTASSSKRGTRTRRFSTRTRPGPRSCAGAPQRGPSSVPPTWPGFPRSACARSPISTPQSSPALLRCGWGLERNRNGGNAAAAVLALPAVGGKFGVRGGGFTMSNSASWDIARPWLRAQEPATRVDQHEPARPRAHRAARSAGEAAVRLQLQPRRRRCPISSACCEASRAKICSPSSSTRCSPTRRTSPTSSCRRPRSSSTTTSRGVRAALAPARPPGRRPGRRVAIERRRVRRRSPTGSASLRARRADGRARCCWSIVMRGLPAHASTPIGRRTQRRGAVERPADPVRRRLPAHAGPQGRTSSRRRSTGRRRSDSTATSRIPRPRRSRWRSSRRQATAPSARRSASCRVPR